MSVVGVCCVARTDRSCWNTNDNLSVGHVTGHDGACANNTIVPDRYARKYDRAATYPGIISDRDRGMNASTFHDCCARIMLSCEYHYSGTNHCICPYCASPGAEQSEINVYGTPSPDFDKIRSADHGTNLDLYALAKAFQSPFLSRNTCQLDYRLRGEDRQDRQSTSHHATNPPQ